MPENIIALDVGGSSVKSGLVDSEQQIHDTFSTPVDSNGSAESILSTFAGIVQHYLDKHTDIRGVGLGFPSPFDYPNGICLIQGVQKYESIYGVNIGEAIRERLNRPDLLIRFRNDAEAAIVGEALYGAGQPFRRFIGLTLGTGMGSSFIADGKRVTDVEGVPEGGFLFPVLYRGIQSDEWFSTRGLLGRFEAIGQPMPSVSEAAKAAENNPAIRQAFEEFGADMAEFIAPFARSFGAEALILLGGIAAAYPLFGKPLEAGLPVPVIIGALGGNAALLGASDLIRGNVGGAK
jgi:glucokinase